MSRSHKRYNIQPAQLIRPRRLDENCFGVAMNGLATNENVRHA